MKKITINKILNKKGKTPITCLTAYSKDVAKILDKYCDLIFRWAFLISIILSLISIRNLLRKLNK